MLQAETDGSGCHGQQKKSITFLVEGSLFAIDMKYVRELLCSAIVTCIKFDSETKYYPMINFRGKLVRVFDIGILLGRKRKYASMITNVLMIEREAGGGVMAGLVVDSVGEVIQSSAKSPLKRSAASGTGADKLVRMEICEGGATIRVLDMEYFFESEFVTQAQARFSKE